jgi:hypothetical protein
MKWRKCNPPKLVESQKCHNIFNLKVYTVLHSQDPGQQYLHTIRQYIARSVRLHQGNATDTVYPSTATTYPRHCEYHALPSWHVPAEQHFGPVQSRPPHCPYRAEQPLLPVEVVPDAVVVVVPPVELPPLLTDCCADPAPPHPSTEIV